MSEGKELATRELTEEALAASVKADLVDVSELTVPRLKIAQALTAEVVAREAEPGELIHSLTGESYGDAVKLVLVDAFKGRSWRDREDNKHWANKGVTSVPWEEHPCYGQPFVDCPDAEEQYRAAVQANEKDWGKGPGISTTYNFVGLVVGDDGELDNFPVRVTLERSGAKEGRNLMTMLHLSRAPWDVVYELSTSSARSKKGDPYIAVRVKQVGRTTDEQKQAAVNVAQMIHAADSITFDEVSDEEGGAGVQRPVDAPTGGIEL